MKMLCFAVVCLLVACAGNANADESPMDRVVRAAALSDAGEFRAAIDEIEPLLHANTGAANDAATGIAWNIHGLALQALGDREEARRSYDAAVSILHALPEQRRQYASALDNLGSLEAESGRFVEARSLRLRAEQIYASLGDHAGVARTSSALALTAIGQRKPKEALRRIADAFREESLLPAPDAGDLAELYGAQALAQEREGNYKPAFQAAQQALELWAQHYGSRYYLLATGYSLRGRAYDGLHDYQNAINDMQHSLELMRENGQSKLRVYFLTELSYALVLRHAGIKDEAAQTESTARLELSNLREPCTSCVVSAESLSLFKGIKAAN